MTKLEDSRDVFLSHRSADKRFVRRLQKSITTADHRGLPLSVWLDEAEIRPGHSIPGMVNKGLESSRFIALVMTPAYFKSESGWTDAEWHAALHQDPDNRRARLIPLLAEDCPYIPYLLRHLSAIDFRSNYSDGVRRLLAVLREEPLPKPVTHRGQLIATGGRIDRATLLSERAIPQADPDVVSEHLYCNLLPVERIPQHVYTAPIANSLLRKKKDGSHALPSKKEMREAIRLAQTEAEVSKPFMPAFRIFEDRIVTFHDLESEGGPLAPVAEDSGVEILQAEEMLRTEDGRRLVVSLLNMAVSRHVARIGLVIDRTKDGRYFFPPKNGDRNEIAWKPRKAKARRTVAKACLSQDGTVSFWRHQGAYLRMIFLANKLYLQITPTWVLTEDGVRVKAGPKVGRLVTRWTNPERNLQVLYHVRFWTTVLRTSPGPICIRAGDQRLELATVPASIHQAYGIISDSRDLLGLLDEEAQLIAETEEQIADEATEAELLSELEEIDGAEWQVDSDKYEEKSGDAF